MTGKIANIDLDARTHREAERWLVRLLDLGEAAPERAEFERWLAANPAHVEAYRQTEWLWTLGTEAARHPDAVQSANQILRETAATRPRLRYRRLTAYAAAVALVVLTAIGAVWWQVTDLHQWQAHYVTAVGQQKTIALKDGSSVLLDTDSSINVHFSPDARQVKLLKGRAEFHDLHDPARPFTVQAGTGTVTALGTTFQVSVGTRGHVGVVLIQGKVTVEVAHSRATLTKGEAVQYDRAGLVAPVHPADITAALGWPQGEVIVHDWRLPRLLAEMNRYSRTQLAIADPALREVRISGRFRTGDQQTLEQVLQAGWSIHAAKVAPHSVLLFTEATPNHDTNHPHQDR